MDGSLPEPPGSIARGRWAAQDALSGVPHDMKSNLVGRLADRARSAASEYPPISRPEVAEVEARLGFSLPTTLHQIYSGIANGGFGPGYKIIGLVGGMPLDTGHSALEIYEAFLQPDP